MTVSQAWFLGSLCMLSVLLPLVLIPLLIWRHKRKGDAEPMSLSKKLLVLSGLLIGSIWCLRFAVGLFMIYCPAPGEGVLNPLEEIFNSIAHTLQTFSMDEEYTAYILNGKQMIGIIAGFDTAWVWLYGLYASLLNFIAPIAGGAIIFEILASVFPRLRLWFAHLARWKEKFYFSELNERSLALARNIYETYEDHWHRPVIVFTDVYTDEDNENSAELLLGARAIGAICLRDDIQHIKKNRRGKRTFFLMDENESSNLQALTDLSGDANRRFLRCAEVYLFSQDDIYTQVEQQVAKRLENDPDFPPDEFPTIIPVQGYRNLITNLLVELPLYEPLIHKPRDKDGRRDLNVTIIGVGATGTAMFLSTYWMGQMLDCRLNINIVSQEDEDAFWGRVDYISPEIHATATPGDPILRYNLQGDCTDPYCRVNYIKADVQSEAFYRELYGKKASLLNTDYFFVSLGSDARNLNIAEQLKRAVGQYHVRFENPPKTVITYVIYDPDLNETLNLAQMQHSCKQSADIYMRAVGSLLDVYSVRNVFDTAYRRRIEEVNNAYDMLRSREDREKKHKARARDDYKYWASRARGMHVNYKLFSLGMLTRSVFNSTEEECRAETRAAYEQYKRLAKGEPQEGDEQAREVFLREIHRLSWLEHRRWNAFTRVKGFRGTAGYDHYFDEDGDKYKHMRLKLHPCLVECDEVGIRGKLDEHGRPIKDTTFLITDKEELDLLDLLSYDLKEKGYNGYDFKLYDYPVGDF